MGEIIARQPARTGQFDLHRRRRQRLAVAAPVGADENLATARLPAGRPARDTGRRGCQRDDRGEFGPQASEIQRIGGAAPAGYDVGPLAAPTGPLVPFRSCATPTDAPIVKAPATVPPGFPSDT